MNFRGHDLSGAETRRVPGADMATIIEFRQGLRPAALPRSIANAQAQIVFFPGVRYERWAEEVSAEPAKKRARRRRDKIVLDD